MGIPVILFGAFDRHNFGDLLLPHIASALLPGHDPIYAGLARRDLRAFGGHEVKPLARLATEWGGSPVALIHVGGEVLTCDAWQAAVMLQPPPQLRDTLAYLEARPRERLDWVQRALGTRALAPYTLARELFPGMACVIYGGVGGVGLADCDPAVRAEVVGKLRAADHVSVRDRQTQAQLHAAGVAASLIPDPAVMVAELFGAQIRRHARAGEVAAVRRAFPDGYVAVQFSAEFGDDETLAQMASQLGRTARSSGCGVALFRAGAAPWHDDLETLRRVAGRIAPSARVFSSLGLWDICALIASSRAYCGSSLHGRIVAMAFALPRVSLRAPASRGRADKTTAFAAAWDDPGVAATIDVAQIEDGVGQALSVDPRQLRRRARHLVSAYRRGFGAIRRALSGERGA